MYSKYEIIPFKSAGPVFFGMTKEEVKRTLGEPFRVSKISKKTDLYVYEHINIYFSKADNLVREVLFDENANVVIGDVNVFGDQDALKRLIAMDGKPYEYFGAIMLFNLGITLGGFHNDDDKTITVFKENILKKFKQKAKPFVFEDL
ncbi:hypothetical protein ACFL02_06940 [Planctomycetota bacterium]